MITIMGTLEETDNIVEAIAIAGACDLCPGAAECAAHRNDPETDKDAEFERLSCGEVIRKNVNIIVKGG